MIKLPPEIWQLCVPGSNWKYGSRDGADWEVLREFTDYEKLKNFAKRNRIKHFMISKREEEETNES